MWNPFRRKRKTYYDYFRVVKIESSIAQEYFCDDEYRLSFKGKPIGKVLISKRGMESYYPLANDPELMEVMQDFMDWWHRKMSERAIEEAEKCQKKEQDKADKVKRLIQEVKDRS